MRLKKVRLIITPALILFCITVVGLFFLKTVVQRPAVQRYLIESLSRSFGYDLRIDKVNMSLWKGIGVRAQALEATSRSGPERHITASSVAITFNTWQLIRGRIVPTKIFLLRPHIAISLVNEPESSKTKNEITDIKEIIHKSLSQLDSVLMQEARIHIKEHPFQIEGLHMSVRKLSHTSRKLHMDIQGKLESKDEVIPFSLDGSISLKKRTQKDISVDLMLQTKDVPLPSFLTHSPLPVKEGTAEAELKIKGMLDGPLAVEGKISTQNLRFLFAKRDILYIWRPYIPLKP
jgi:hypothetical protein